MQDYSDAPQFLRDFLTYIDTIKGKSKRTADAYYADLKTFFRFLKIHKNFVPIPQNFRSENIDDAISSVRDISISDVTIDLIRDVSLQDMYEYMAYLNRTRGNESYARARKVSSIKSFFKYLTNKVNLLEENVAKELESPKIGKSLPKYLGLEDSISLLSAVTDGKNKERDYLILTLFLNCGLRLSELTGININNIKNNILTVVGKGNKERTIYLNAACENAIYEYLRERPNDKAKDKNALILSKNYQRIGARSVEKIVKKYIQLAGLDPQKYSPHKLRHTAATLMYKHGNVDIRVLQEILGHQSLSTTEIYTHVDDERLRSAVESNPLATITGS